MVLVSVLVFVVVFLVEVECGIFLIMTGPQGTGKTSFVQTIVNASIELETIGTRTNNNNKDDRLGVAITTRGVCRNKCLNLLDIYCWQHSCVQSIVQNEIRPYSQWKGIVDLHK